MYKGLYKGTENNFDSITFTFFSQNQMHSYIACMISFFS